MGMFRKHLLATVLVGISATGWARVNSLEPWAPGFDANVSSQKWNHAVFAHVANSGAYGTDTTGLGYSLTTPLWKKLGTGRNLGDQNLGLGRGVRRFGTNGFDVWV
jgi:hypothetical protein